MNLIILITITLLISLWASYIHKQEELFWGGLGLAFLEGLGYAIVITNP